VMLKAKVLWLSLGHCGGSNGLRVEIKV
jgi:hypothetical protein